ncbi:SDR family NAD(P)-dependent oxidoreductase [Halococcus sediminicola]|uniref:SDR family NAD(P)-dependent oxidoreductase n=1 Tax=Halococcus sediminicola TaxID=1264579 RepID=UPI000679DB87|nr:SDR family NAD(P)-dependent oxidoreductase [Halococcus sediminicola]
MNVEEFQIEGSTAVVTGSSSGIGRAIVERFADQGLDVVVTSRSRENVEPVATAINERPGGDALPIECDIRDWDAIEALVEETTETLGPIDVWINNAGASFMAPFEEISQNGWQTIVDINLNGAFNCTQVVGEWMRENDGGTIVNVSSVAARDGAPQMIPYAAAKAGMDKLTWTLAYEWAKYDIRINGVMPGLVATEGLASQEDIEADDISRERVDREIGLPDEIATVAQFLASPAASYIQGQTIVAEGIPRIPRTSLHEN